MIDPTDGERTCTCHERDHGDGIDFWHQTGGMISAEGSEAFEALPVAIRNLGPWTGSKEGEVGHLRLSLRSLVID